MKYILFVVDLFSDADDKRKPRRLAQQCGGKRILFYIRKRLLKTPSVILPYFIYPRKDEYGGEAFLKELLYATNSKYP